MICHKAEPYMMDFIENRLEIKKLKEFVEHLKVCKCCREELNLTYMATTAMQKLDEGQDFDIEEETQLLLDNAQLEIDNSEKLKILFPIGLGILFIMIILVLFWIYVL